MARAPSKKDTRKKDGKKKLEPIDWAGVRRFGPLHALRLTWLLVLYAVIISYTFATLGAWQFQDRMREIVGDRENADRLRTQLVVGLDERLVHQKELRATLKALEDSLTSILGRDDGAAQAAEPTTVEDIKADTGEPDPIPASDQYPQAEKVEVLRAHLDQMQALLAPVDGEEGLLIAALLSEIKPLFERHNAAQEIEALRLLADFLTVETIRSPIVTPLFYVSGLENVPRQLAIWPEGHLTIMLTLLMGALGSLLFVTRSFLAWQFKGYSISQPSPKPLSWFVFRPLFGAITALTILILVKAGQMSFASGSSVSLKDGGVNPFIIAFAAIIAGLMSWQALERIESIGERWLCTGRRRDLWATGLKNALTVRNRTIRSLADQIGRSAWQIERWILLKDKVIPEMQDRITAWLEASRTELFSEDLPHPPPTRPSLVAMGLPAALEAAGKNAEGLAKHLRRELAEVRGWLEQREPVPPDDQDAIAAWLERPVAELFDTANPPAS